MTYKDLAPTFQGLGVTEANVLAVEKPTKNSSTEPVLTKEKALSLLDEFDKDAVPYTELAQKHGLTSSQVKKLHQEWLKVRAKADYVPLEE